MTTPRPEADPRELGLLEAARAGDGDALGLLVEPRRKELHVLILAATQSRSAR